MTNLEAKQALARKLDIDYANIALNGLFTAADLQGYLQTGVQIAWGRHPWDFTEGAKTGTLAEQNITAGYVDAPQDFSSADSLDVNGLEFPEEQKLRYRDYVRWQQQNPTSTDKYWSEYRRYLFLNMNACAVGQPFDVYGKLRCPTLSADADLLPFSPDTDNQEDAGNSAIIDLAFAEAKESDKLKDPNAAAALRTKAVSVLDALWKPMKASQANQVAKNRPFFNTPDFFASRGSLTNNIGNF